MGHDGDSSIALILLGIIPIRSAASFLVIPAAFILVSIIALISIYLFMFIRLQRYIKILIFIAFYGKNIVFYVN